MVGAQRRNDAGRAGERDDADLRPRRAFGDEGLRRSLCRLRARWKDVGRGHRSRRIDAHEDANRPEPAPECVKCGPDTPRTTPASASHPKALAAHGESTPRLRGFNERTRRSSRQNRERSRAVAAARRDHGKCHNERRCRAQAVRDDRCSPVSQPEGGCKRCAPSSSRRIPARQFADPNRSSEMSSRRRTASRTPPVRAPRRRRGRSLPRRRACERSRRAATLEPRIARNQRGAVEARAQVGQIAIGGASRSYQSPIASSAVPRGSAARAVRSVRGRSNPCVRERRGCSARERCAGARAASRRRPRRECSGPRQAPHRTSSPTPRARRRAMYDAGRPASTATCRRSRPT